MARNNKSNGAGGGGYQQKYFGGDPVQKDNKQPSLFE